MSCSIRCHGTNSAAPMISRTAAPNSSWHLAASEMRSCWMRRIKGSVHQAGRPVIVTTSAVPNTRAGDGTHTPVKPRVRPSEEIRPVPNVSVIVAIETLTLRSGW
ncbi:MAG: hypothetical protein AVDCRST_MAG64-3922 [uncultured Phycisphaerae bacterium]|uniref:Uncharacterized protein n=1 Tax=uncultured Phycisphaerae bacterium TaxID=904963 RepID=A0A6J4QC39_9BACT|nr:MAG: hypothetical protein AVDCRST_MAG64-3922 [uncultured Phycisphaerae bacterium]